MLLRPDRGVEPLPVAMARGADADMCGCDCAAARAVDGQIPVRATNQTTDETKLRKEIRDELRILVLRILFMKSETCWADTRPEYSSCCLCVATNQKNGGMLAITIGWGFLVCGCLSVFSTLPIRPTTPPSQTTCLRLRQRRRTGRRTKHARAQAIGDGRFRCLLAVAAERNGAECVGRGRVRVHVGQVRLRV